MKNGLIHQYAPPKKGKRPPPKNTRKKKRKYKGIIICLPEHMDFSENYDVTMQHLTVISRLVELIKKNKGRALPKSAYNLASVNFDNLKSISTPAALVLTAEISSWDDSLRNQLTPKVEQWNNDIYSQFHDLGFFDLFNNKPKYKPCTEEHPCSDKRLVKYKKGECGVKGKTKELKNDLIKIVGNDINKWTFLHTGLGEAITNVSHHAYPDNCETRIPKKQWFLTGSFHEPTRTLKVAFYDQGIGIPKTLPASKIKEKVAKFLAKSGYSALEKKRDEIQLKAAVEIDRTKTGKNDRGKGLQDLLEFIRQRKSGRLSILSNSGHYTYSINEGKKQALPSHLSRPILGTLIIWSVVL
ncbi:hypothetical protein [Vibrio parahaemolyticus]